MAGPGPDIVREGAGGASAEVLHCVNHPQTETLIRCSRCLDPICLKCAVRTPVGLRCRRCAGVGRSPLYVLAPEHYVLAAAVALVVSMIAGTVMTQLGFFWFTLILAMPAGGLIAEIVLRSTGGKRGRAIQLITAVAIALGAFAGPWLWRAISAGTLAALPANPLVYLAGILNINSILYAALAISAAVARLR